MGYLSSARRVGLSVCVCVYTVCVCACDALYEAVILSILVALKQSDNPSVVNPRTAAQAASVHSDSTQGHAPSHRDRGSTLIQHAGGGFMRQN